MESYLIFDISVIIFVFLSAIFSFTRGFSQETLSLFSWTSAFFISYFSADFFSTFTKIIITNELVANITTYLIIFIISLFFLSFLTNKFSSSIKKSSVGMIDRSLGFIFGILRGYILLCLFYFAFSKLYNDQIPNWLEKSKMNYLIMHGTFEIVYFFDKENKSAQAIENKLKNKSDSLFEKSINSHLRREKKSEINKGYDKEDRDSLNYLFENIENE